MGRLLARRGDVLARADDEVGARRSRTPRRSARPVQPARWRPACRSTCGRSPSPCRRRTRTGRARPRLRPSSCCSTRRRSFTGSAAGKNGANASISLTFDYQYDKSVRPRGSITLRYSDAASSGRQPAVDRPGRLGRDDPGRPGRLRTATRSLRLRVDDDAERGPTRSAPRSARTTRARSRSRRGDLRSHPTSG